MESCEFIKHVDDQNHYCCEHLDEETLRQGVARVARGVAENQVVGDNQVGQQDDRHHVRVEIHPLEGVVDVQHLVACKIEVVVEHTADGGTCNITDASNLTGGKLTCFLPLM